MIQMNSRVFIADNTGAKSAEMIRRLPKQRHCRRGDVVVCAGRKCPPILPSRRAKSFVP